MMLRWFKNPVKKSSSSQATYIYVLRACTQSSLHAFCTSLPQISILSHIHVREYVHLKKKEKKEKGGKGTMNEKRLYPSIWWNMQTQRHRKQVDRFSFSSPGTRICPSSGIRCV